MILETLYNFVVYNQTLFGNAKAYKNEFALRTHDLTRKVILFLYTHSPWNIYRPFITETSKRFHFNKNYNDYVKQFDLTRIKHKILTYTRIRIFLSWETVYNFVVNNQSINLGFRKHNLRRKKISFFYIHNPWNIINTPLIRETCKLS